MIEIPEIIINNISLKYNDNYMGNDILNLPQSIKYGNMTLKYISILDRQKEINFLINECYTIFNKFSNKQIYNSDTEIEIFNLSNFISRYYFVLEYITYNVRRTVDELISLIYYLNYIKNNNGTEPNKIDIDKIGSLINSNEGQSLKNQVNFFTQHDVFMNYLNDLSNAFKHSFVNSESSTLIGKDKPTINALNLHYNNSSNNKEFYSIYLDDFITCYNSFFNDSFTCIKELA